MSLYQILIMVILMYGGQMFFTESLDLVYLPARDPNTQQPTDRMRLNTILFQSYILMTLCNKLNCKSANLDISVLMSNKIFWVVMIAELGVQSLLIMVGATDLGQALLGITSIETWQHVVCILLGLSVIPVNLGIQKIDASKFDFTSAFCLEEESEDSPINKFHRGVTNVQSNVKAKIKK